MKLNFLYPNIEKDMDMINHELKQAIISAEAETTTASALHLLEAGGKRIRPLFVCLTARLTEKPDQSKMKYAAVAVELIHMASIVHDDVVDNASLRRGRETIKSRWGNHIAMYTGDYLFAKSLDYMTNIKEIEAHEMLASVTVELATGEIEQLKSKYDVTQSIRTYLRRIKRKTALLIAVSCGLGAVISGQDAATTNKLYQFGYYVGMAFQIQDDVLDFVGSQKELGKPAGEDLRQGNITLPVFMAMASEPTFKTKLQQLSSESSADFIAECISIVKASKAAEQADEIADRYLEKATAILETLPRSTARKSLKQIVSSLEKRKS